ncbi:MAG: HK97 family phage prohead protease [Alphaproteobacteria bacterium]|nr:MAG: HK97 family phage prohead protease [Alphaproteobacteria bacterium]
MILLNQETEGQIGHFEGYASVFNVVDRGNDLILPGAFRRSLLDRRASGIKFLWQHDPKEPVGILDEVYEDARGLYVQGRLILDVARAQEAYQLLGAGALDGLSIGFHTLKSKKRADGVRLLLDVDLWEISLVTFPMNEQARISAFKTDFITAADETAVVAGLRHLTALMAPSTRNDTVGNLQRNT